MCESSLFIASRLHFRLDFRYLNSHHQQVISKLENTHTMKFHAAVNLNQSELLYNMMKEYKDHKGAEKKEVANKLIQKDLIYRVQKQNRKKK